MTSDTAPTKALHGKIQTVQVLRGLAAFAVVLYHTQLIFSQPEYGGLKTNVPGASMGWSGVNFFFVLSGFIISYAHAKDFGKPQRLYNYFMRRFIRVYPLYWLILTAFIIATSVGIGTARFDWSALNIVSVYSLLQIVDAPSLPLRVAWTLYYEVAFYIVFASLMLSRRLGAAVITAWIALTIYNTFIIGNVEMSPLHIWNIYFLAGMAVYQLYIRIDHRWAPALLATGALELIFVMWLIGDGTIGIVEKSPLDLLLLAVPFASILLGAILVERASSLRPHSFLVLLGGASYSIYLIHSPAISIIALINRKVALGLLPPTLLFFLTAAFATAAGIAIHLWIETPMMRWLQRWNSTINERATLPPSRIEAR